jgi:transposase
MIEALAKRSAGLDVHKRTVVCTVLIENAHGQIEKQTREFGTFRKELNKLAEWLSEFEVEIAVMESTGIYWKSVYEALERKEVKACVVNARHVKNVPGRKTDVQDSEWLAELARCGLLRASFIPPHDLRELRLLTRYRGKLVGTLSAEKNRLHKILDGCGIRLGNVVSDIDGVSAREMIEALIEGNKEPYEIVLLARGRLNKKIAELIEALDGELSDRHRFILKQIHSHIKWLEDRVREINRQVVAAMKPYREEWHLLQTIPGIDELCAAMLLAEIGPDMSCFGSKDHLSSWAGMCPGNNESAGKKKSGHIRSGDEYVRQLLCEAANSARKTNSQFNGMYKGLVIRRGHKRTIIALGHKILEVVRAMLKNKQPYHDPGVNYEQIAVNRNAARWIQALKKYGYWPAQKQVAG